MGRIVKNGISYGGTGTVDPILDQQSSNPVENKAVAKAIADINTVITEIDNSVTYSYDEQAVGTWVDGSTIYKKTVHPTNLTREARYEFSPETGYHFTNLIKVDIMNTYVDSTYNYQWAGYCGNDRILIESDLNRSTGIIAVNFHNPNPIADAYLTFYYTKEADS